MAGTSSLFNKIGPTLRKLLMGVEREAPVIENAAAQAERRALQKGEESLMSRTAQAAEEAPSISRNVELVDDIPLQTQPEFQIPERSPEEVEDLYNRYKRMGQEPILEPIPAGNRSQPVAGQMDERVRNIEQRASEAPAFNQRPVPPKAPGIPQAFDEFGPSSNTVGSVPPGEIVPEAIANQSSVLQSSSKPESLLDKIKRNRGQLAATGILGATALSYLGGSGSGQESGLPPVPETSQPETTTPQVAGPEAVTPNQGPVASNIETAQNAAESPKAHAPGGPALTDIDFGQGGVDALNLLQNAQQAAQENQSGANWGRIGDIIGGAISGQGPKFQDFYKDLSAQSGQPIQNAKELIKAQEDDPNSPAANAFKSFAKKLGYNIKGAMSLSEAKNLIPHLYKEFEAGESRRAKKEDLGYKYDQLKELADIRKGEKKDVQINKDVAALGNKLTEELAFSKSTFGKASNNLQVIKGAEALLAGETNLDDLDTRQLQETARVLDRLLSGGQPTISATQELKPETARATIAHYLEYFTNKRQGAGAGDFIKNMQNTFQREKKVNENIIRGAKNKILAGYQHIEKDSPEDWNRLMRVHNLEDVLGTDTSVERKTPKQDPKIAQWAKQHGLPYEKAEDILRKRGYGG